MSGIPWGDIPDTLPVSEDDALRIELSAARAAVAALTAERDDLRAIRDAAHYVVARRPERLAAPDRQRCPVPG